MLADVLLGRLLVTHRAELSLKLCLYQDTSKTCYEPDSEQILVVFSYSITLLLVS